LNNATLKLLRTYDASYATILLTPIGVDRIRLWNASYLPNTQMVNLIVSFIQQVYLLS